jgi:hypothetical protein
MTATANPDLSEIDETTLRRLRIMSSLSVAIFGLIGLGFFLIFRSGESISEKAQHRQNILLGASGITLLAGGILLLAITFWRSSRSLSAA